jgi:hypothetical protein
MMGLAKSLTGDFVFGLLGLSGFLIAGALAAVFLHQTTHSTRFIEA